MTVFKNFLLAIGISLLFGFLGLLLSSSFLVYFLASLGIQLVIYPIINQILLFVANLNIHKWQLARLSELDRNIADLACASCGKINNVLINVAEDNEFECEHCKVKNSVLVQLYSAQKTNIVTKKDILTQEDVEKLEKVLPDGPRED